MIYSPNGNIHFKYVYGTGFQAPSMFYKYEQWGAEKNVMLSEEEVRRLYPQWSLTNQKLETHDVSFSWKIGKKVLVNMSFFSNQFDDVIERVTFSDSVYNKYYSSDDTSVYSRGIRNENIGYQYTYGANLNLNFNVNNNFSFYFSYSYLDGYSQLKAVKSDLSGIANHKFWMGVNARNLVKNLNLSLRFKQSGRINNSNLFYYPQGKQPGYANLDFYADYRHLFDRLTIYLNITNVLDQDYRHAGLYQQSGGYLPAIEQDLRMFKFGIELLF
jgi:outer membrane cobalamin receptor